MCIADTDNFSNTSIDIITSLGARFIQIDVDRKGINPFSDFQYFLKLLNLFKKERPNLVICYTVKPVIYGSIAASIAKIPSFTVLTGLGSSFIQQGILIKIIFSLLRLSLSKTKKVFFLNETDKKIFLHHNLCSSEKAFLLPGEGIDTQEYDRCETVPSEKIRFLLIARLLKDKGVYEFIEAAKSIKKDFPKTEFLLAGGFYY